MNRITQLISQNRLRPTDAIVMRKRFLGMVDHYVLFMGFRKNQPVFIANYRTGVQEVSERDIAKYLEFLDPERIEYFPGNEIERENAIKRAWSKVGKNAYDYLSDNCEHFKNFVHFGKHYSGQVDAAGNGALAAGAAVTIAGLASKDKTVTYVGLGALLIGGILKYLADDED